MRKLKIQEIIPLTLQGEGFNAGMPCSFVRFFGCPVGCYFCDTGYSTGEERPPAYREMTVGEIKAELLSDNVVITGGEPFVNQDFSLLLSELSDKKVSIETSGIKYSDALTDEWVTLSPKQHLNKKALVDKQLAERANELKLVIAKDSDFFYYFDLIEQFQKQNKPVYFQPEWSEMKSKLVWLVALANTSGVKLSLQTHKLIGMR